MFENFGKVTEDGRRDNAIFDSDEQSDIPEISEDGYSDMIMEEVEAADESERDAEALQENVLDFISQTDLTFLVTNKMDDDELRAELDIKIEQYVAKKRKEQKRANFRMQFEDKEWSEAMKDVVEMNLRDSRRIDKIKGFIIANRANPEKMKAFWSDFKTVFYGERKNRNKQCEYQTPTTIRSGILGELAAQDLLKGAEDYFSDPEFSEDDSLRFRGIDFAKIGVSVEETTPEEDVLQQTDLKLHISYEDKRFVLPVQVKCKYMKSMDSEMGDFIAENACIFSRHGIGSDAPYGKNIKRFFKNNPDGGVFMVVPYGCESYDIGDDGFPSNKLRLLVYEQIKIEIYDFLRGNLSQEE